MRNWQRYYKKLIDTKEISDKLEVKVRTQIGQKLNMVSNTQQIKGSGTEAVSRLKIKKKKRKWDTSV